jgi:PAS domain S-box-containing protein
MKCKDGTYKWVLDRGKVIKRDEEGKPVRVIGTCVDITERKELEELLKANEARWNSALEGSEIGVWDWNIVTNEVFHSKQLETMLGYSEGEVDYPVTDWATKVHPDDLAYVYEQLEAHLGGDTSIYVAEYRYRCKDGSYIWVLDRGKVIEWLEDGKPLRAIGTYLDITQKREDAKKIKTREERWNFALEGSEIGVWDFNQELNETIYSKQWKAMLGYEKDEIGNTYEEWESRLHPDELDLLKESKVNLNAGKTDLFTEEYRMRCKDGSYKWVLDKGKVIEKDADGIPTRVVGMHLDITDRKELEIESDFLSTLLRHDLLNRLIVVNGFLTIIDTSDFSDDNKSYVQKALRAVNQSSELVEKIANLRILRQKIPIEVINLTILCAEVISQTKILAEEKGVTIETDYCTSPCSVKGSHLTKEMLTNLIENSLNHSKGSIIRISTIGAIDEVIMVIEDDGVGIDESIRKKLFQRGVKGKFSKGSGIGLFIVKKIVESSGGLIEVTESELGGVKFEVILPKAK